uniref:Uncharacterized protein n=1 Tax=Physcomitrium patens TaxID=3218 RepID=A0A2K1KCC5_PHYPA|nr:hypothetical protein PHYPA_010621 [Physcomitrium patens]
MNYVNCSWSLSRCFFLMLSSGLYAIAGHFFPLLLSLVVVVSDVGLWPCSYMIGDALSHYLLHEWIMTIFLHFFSSEVTKS